MDRLVGDLIPSAVQAAWGLSADDRASPLNGGGNRSVRVGDVVFKPVDDIVEATWCGLGHECLGGPSGRSGYRNAGESVHD